MKMIRESPGNRIRELLTETARKILAALAGRLGTVAGRISKCRLKLLLAAGVLVSAGLFIWAALHAWREGRGPLTFSGSTSRVGHDLPAPGSDTGKGYREQQGRRAGAIFVRIDSLARTQEGKRSLDSIKRFRPGLLDSAALLEKIIHNAK